MRRKVGDFLQRLKETLASPAHRRCPVIRDEKIQDFEEGRTMQTDIAARYPTLTRYPEKIVIAAEAVPTNTRLPGMMDVTASATPRRSAAAPV